MQQLKHLRGITPLMSTLIPLRSSVNILSSSLSRFFVSSRSLSVSSSPQMSTIKMKPKIREGPIIRLSDEEERANRVLQLISSREPMKSLSSDWYSPFIHSVDLEFLWKPSWLFAGFTYEIPNAGDYFVYKVDRDETIIVRGDDGKIRAFANTCRHRGSRICRHSHGTVNKFVCPYHQWTYDREGRLVFARDMPEDFKKADNGLRPVNVREMSGLIHICLSENAPRFDYEPAKETVSRQLKLHELHNAKSAHTEIYNVEANWKVVFENNRECYHCNVRHPEYIRSNYDTSFTYQKIDGKVVRLPDPRISRSEEIESFIEAKTKSWEQLGLECSSDSSFPGEGWYRATRNGWMVESLDGKPVSKLMGSLPHYDMGSLRIHTLPNFWVHISSDHGVSARLTPTSPNSTEIKVDWIVHKDAKEGVDYHLDKLLPFWKLTSEQDWDLCVENQRGINSSRYTSGQFSEYKELGLEKYVLWYLNTVKRSAEQIIGEK